MAYYRVSTDKQGQSGLGLDAQRAAVELHARSVGAEVIAEFRDVESGRKADRTGLAAALATCRAKRATLLIAKLDRLARSVQLGQIPGQRRTAFQSISLRERRKPHRIKVIELPTHSDLCSAATACPGFCPSYRSVAFISNLMEGGVDFVAADMPSVNRLTVHVLAAVAEHEREMISQRTKAALAAAKVRGTKLGNPRLPATGTLAAAPQPSTPRGKARIAAAQARAVTAYGAVVQAARTAGALSLGDYAQALQAARVQAPRGGDRWSRPSVARVLRYCAQAEGCLP